MNKRIFMKVFKRANDKIYTYISANKDKRTTYQIAKEESILSPLERKVFIKKQEDMIRFMDEIISELKAEGKW